jgi:hypothetical protein
MISMVNLSSMFSGMVSIKMPSFSPSKCNAFPHGHLMISGLPSSISPLLVEFMISAKIHSLVLFFLWAVIGLFHLFLKIEWRTG